MTSGFSAGHSMTPLLRQLASDRNEAGIEQAFFEDACRDFVAVDWRAEDTEIVRLCAVALELPTLRAERRGQDLTITCDGNEVVVRLQHAVGDRHLTICSLNDLISSHHQLRYMVCSVGSDTAGFAALSNADWQLLEAINPTFVAENFIDPRQLPNVITELTALKLPLAAQARWQRMLDRN
jgi:hypothetical protein